MYYHTLGRIPPKRHTQFRKPDQGLYREEVMGARGFSGRQSILYHLRHPTRITRVAELNFERPEYVDYGPLRHRHFLTAHVPRGGDAVTGRRVLLGNDDVTMAVARPTDSMSYFYRNGQCFEVIFVHEGSGTLRSVFGTLVFGPGDYIVVPVSTTWLMEFDGSENRLLVFETPREVGPPGRYVNEVGQFLEHAPYCERDVRVPEELDTFDELGEFEVRVKARNQLTAQWLDHHPFDVIGWDGYLYPWIFNIADYEPLTGRIHQPPPVHQTFQGQNFVLCSFVPRMFDYHPLSIPAPYNHANVNSDEVLYYVDGQFMSRRGVGRYDITLHPSGLPHGPHPGTVEASIGKRSTEETAVMMDTFRPLNVARYAEQFENPEYAYSWVPNGREVEPMAELETASAAG
jgi:homogentisate 1,2-dioxygenase